ncbi:hypothetical protein T4B_6310 [Trichinella pseudospiralis]|uniref:Uncharacterized protein n=1 Tax=Trichinella pseudospiralis TaxID=6337 RepID=A0A0V1J2K7_TRIPS|nr:hypothetical protein T4B_6310 [Trichinella pseudospiralis]
MSQNIYIQTQTELFTKTHSLNVMKMLPKLLPELSVDMPLNVVEHSFEKLHSEVLLCKKIVTCDVVTLRPLIMYRDKCFSCFNLHILLTWTFHHMPYFAGMLGLYCLIGHSPQKATWRSSVVTFGRRCSACLASQSSKWLTVEIE